MLQSPQPPPVEALLTGLINDIAAAPDPFLLVLDDYHLIHTLPIHQQLAFLLEHQPAHMHLVIASREDPPLPLSRLRARAQMVEIRQADLTFTPVEAAAFLRRTMGLELSAADVATLQRRTEGWVAGLQLAALSVRGSDDAERLIGSFAGSHRYILDYLVEEVFSGQPDHIRGFLLKTSILDRFTAALCDAVRFGDSDAAAAERVSSREILLELDHANLFMVPLDACRKWYRFHRLFADLLRQQLRRADFDVPVSELHRRASRWYEAEGFQSDAVKHALAARDWERAAGLILGAEDRMLRRGEVVTLLGWLQALPDEALRSHPQLYLSTSWALILTGQLDAAESTLAAAERVAQDIGCGEGQAASLGAIASAQAFSARTRGDDARTIEMSQRALSLLPEEDLAGRSIVAVNLGIAHWSSGHLTEAEQALREAEQAARQSRNHYARLTALGFLGAVQGAQGRLHKAEAWLRQAIREGGGATPTALAHDTLGALLYEWDDLDAATEHLERGIELGARSGNVETQIGGYRILSRLRQAQGDASGALEAIREAHKLAREKDVSPLMRARNAACHTQIALAQGDLPVALRWAEQVTEAADGSRFYPLLGLTPARLCLAQGEKAAAAEQLEAWYDTAVRAGWQYGVVEVRALQAMAAPTVDEALPFLADALARAEPEGYVRTFVDKGEPMGELLQEAARRGLAPAYTRRLLDAFLHPPAHPRLVTQPLIEPLSERELEVLKHLAHHKTNQEIAQALVISINTVKTHLKNIYGKLGVHDRREAVAKAQELDLLP
jgi:LuxR family maltose regulon positive regulatory protein